MIRAMLLALACLFTIPLSAQGEEALSSGRFLDRFHSFEVVHESKDKYLPEEEDELAELASADVAENPILLEEDEAVMKHYRHGHQAKHRLLHLRSKRSKRSKRAKRSQRPLFAQNAVSDWAALESRTGRRLKELGAGGFATVFGAKDCGAPCTELLYPAAGRVAIKLIGIRDSPFVGAATGWWGYNRATKNQGVSPMKGKAVGKAAPATINTGSIAERLILGFASSYVKEIRAFIAMGSIATNVVELKGIVFSTDVDASGNPTYNPETYEYETLVDAAQAGHPLTLADDVLARQLMGLVFEFCDGGTIERDATRDTTFDVRVARLTSILAGFTLLHTTNYVHFDVKSENMLICNNVAKLADLGLATPAATAWQDYSAITALATDPFRTAWGDLVDSAGAIFRKKYLRGTTSWCPPDGYAISLAVSDVDMFAFGQVALDYLTEDDFGSATLRGALANQWIGGLPAQGTLAASLVVMDANLLTCNVRRDAWIELGKLRGGLDLANAQTQIYPLVGTWLKSLIVCEQRTAARPTAAQASVSLAAMALALTNVPAVAVYAIKAEVATINGGVTSAFELGPLAGDAKGLKHAKKGIIPLASIECFDPDDCLIDVNVLDGNGHTDADYPECIQISTSATAEFFIVCVPQNQAAALRQYIVAWGH